MNNLVESNQKTYVRKTSKPFSEGAGANLKQISHESLDLLVALAAAKLDDLKREPNPSTNKNQNTQTSVSPVSSRNDNATANEKLTQKPIAEVFSSVRRVLPSSVLERLQRAAKTRENANGLQQSEKMGVVSHKNNKKSEKTIQKIEKPKTARLSGPDPEFFRDGDGPADLSNVYVNKNHLRNTMDTKKNLKQASLKERIRQRDAYNKANDRTRSQNRDYKNQINVLPDVEYTAQMLTSIISSMTPTLNLGEETIIGLRKVATDLNKKKIIELSADPDLKNIFERLTKTMEGVSEKMPTMPEIQALADGTVNSVTGSLLTGAKYAGIIFAVLAFIHFLKDGVSQTACVVMMAIATLIIVLDNNILLMAKDALMRAFHYFKRLCCSDEKEKPEEVAPSQTSDTLSEVEFESQIDVGEADTFIEAISIIIFGYTVGTAPGEKSLRTFMKECGSFSRGKEGFKDLSKMVVRLVERITNWVWHDILDKEQIVFVESDIEEVRSWTRECLTIHEEMRAKDENKRFNLTLANSERVHNLWTRGNAMMQKYSKKETQHVRQSIMVQMTYITRLKLKFEQANILAQSIRQIPLSICVRGPSGVGKSAATPVLAAALMARLLPPEQLSEFDMNYETFLYNRQNEHVYWDGYRGQFMVVFDDWLQVKDTIGVKDNEYMDFIRASNLFPFVLHMAELESKGVTAFCSKVILCSTNARRFKPESIEEAEAVGRRFDFIVDHVPPLKFCLPSVDDTDNGDLWNRRLDKTKADDAFDAKAMEYHEFKYQKGQGTYEGAYTGRVWTFYEFVDICVERFKKHENHATDFSAKINKIKKEFLLQRAEVSYDEDGKIVIDKSRADTTLNPQGKFGEIAPTTDIKMHSQGAFDDMTFGIDDRIKGALVVTDPFDDDFGLSEEPGKEMGLLGMYDLDINVKLFYTRLTRNDDPMEILEVMNKKFEKLRKYAYIPALHVMNILYHESEPIQRLMEKKTMKDGDLLDVYIKLSERIAEDKSSRDVFLSKCGTRLHEKAGNIVREHSTILASIIELHGKALGQVQQKYFAFKSWLNYGTMGSMIVDMLSVFFIGGLFQLAGKAISGIVSKLFAVFGWDEGYTSQSGHYEGEKKQGKSTQRRTAKTVRMQKDSATRYLAAQGGGDAVTGNKDVDPVITQIQTKVHERSLYEFWITAERKAGFVLFIKDRVAMLPFHYIGWMGATVDSRPEMLNAYAELRSCNFDNPIVYKVSWRSILDTFQQTTIFGSNDLAMWQCDKNVPKHRDITKNFAEHAQTIRVRDQWFNLAIPNTETKTTKVHSSRYYIAEKKFIDKGSESEFIVQKGYEYEAPTVYGDCGSPMYSCDPSLGGKRIIGIHVGGCPKARRGMSTAVCEEDVLECLKLFPDVESEIDNEPNINFEQQLVIPQGNFYAVGEVIGKGVHSSGKTELVESRLHDTYTQATTKPAYLVNQRNLAGEIIKPYEKALKKYCFDDVCICKDTTAAIFTYLFEDIRRTSKVPFERRVLSYEEAVQGIEGETFYGGIPRDTSPGFPHVLNLDARNPGKKAWFGHNGPYVFDTPKAIENRKSCERIIENARNGIRETHIFVDCLKDEKRAIAKVEEGKTRLFSACPLEYSVVVRRYFGAFSKFIMDNRIDNGSAVGINVYSDEWEKLATKLQSTGVSVGAGDYSGFDGSEKPIVFWEMLAMIQRFYDDGEENYKIRKILWEEVVNSKHVRGKTVYAWTASLPSGHPLTVIINTLYNLFAFRYCWVQAHDGAVESLAIFLDHVYVAGYGDDNTWCVSLEKVGIFNQNIITEYMKQIGLTYTSEDKRTGLIDMRTLDEVTFLKRSFRVDNYKSKRFVAPLELGVILEMPMWTKNKKSLTETIVKDNMDTALMELSLHGPERYKEWAPKMIQSYEKNYSIPLRSTTYECALDRALHAKGTHYIKP